MTDVSEDGLRRCWWCGDDPMYMAYHDEEWGVPKHDDQTLFEMLILEGAQAGLSWLTILKKRENYRRAYDHFDIATVAAYTDADYKRLLADPGIVRNKLKLASSISNAKATLAVQEECGSLDQYLWSFVDHTPVRNQFQSKSEVPTETAVSRALSKDLKKRGFKFVGPTIMYAFMQSVGMVQDHLVDCHRHQVPGV